MARAISFSIQFYPLTQSYVSLSYRPYFDDCSAIIFVAAISSFDQYLREDPSVNRLYDALQLFESICNHRLLRSTSIILFLNKIDVLRKKLANGTRLSHYFKDYTGRFEWEILFFQLEMR
jgi:hypothetical protein